MMFYETLDEQVRNEGRIEGIKEGKIEGIKEGEAKGIEKIASNMLKKGYSVEDVCAITNLSLENAEQIKIKFSKSL